jgi:hypothetical protein
MQLMHLLIKFSKSLMQYIERGTALGILIQHLFNDFLVRKLLDTEKRKSLKLQIQTSRFTVSKHGCLCINQVEKISIFHVNSHHYLIIT